MQEWKLVVEVLNEESTTVKSGGEKIAKKTTARKHGIKEGGWLGLEWI